MRNLFWFFFIICGNICCRLCIEAHTNRLAGVFKLAKRSLHVKSQVKQYIYPPAFCKMMMNNLKRCNINLIIIIYSFWVENIFWRGILIFMCLCSIRQFFSFFIEWLCLDYLVKTLVFEDKSSFKIYSNSLNCTALPSKPGFDTYQIKVFNIKTGVSSSNFELNAVFFLINDV